MDNFPLRVWKRLKETGRLMVGVPDYEKYCAHMRAHHPEHSVLTEQDFLARAQEARYGGKKAGKCPC